MRNSEIGEIIQKDPGIAFAFYQLGILFPSHHELPVSGLCDKLNLDDQWLIRNLQELRKSDPLKWTPSHYDMPEVVNHLKSVHKFFIQEKLPFIFHLVNDIDPGSFETPELARDLKMLFPLFYEDFVHHIRAEESQVFEYALLLHQVNESSGNPGLMHFLKSKVDLCQTAIEHLEEDDEMEGIKSLTNNFNCPEGASLIQRVVYWELEKFEKDLRRHSHMENDIFFPLAVDLEKKARKRLSKSLLEN